MKTKYKGECDTCKKPHYTYLNTAFLAQKGEVAPSAISYSCRCGGKITLYLEENFD